LTRDTPIFLVGFMGAGKTTVGRELARRLQFEFFDLDDLIAERAGKTVQAIFAELGEAEFRRLESEAIQRCAGIVRTVIALGGGAYVSKQNRDSLHSIGKTVWLDCPLEICLARIGGDNSRPLLSDKDRMRKLLDERRPAYVAADFTIEVGNQSPEQIAGQISLLLNE